MFLENFLAEVGLSIAIACTIFAFFYKGGLKWKILSYVFLAVISPFYLKLNPDFPFLQIPQFSLILIWVVLIPVGIFVLFKNLKITAYYLVLNPIRPDNKPIKKTKKKLSTKLKMFENLTIFLFATILANITVLSLHKSLEIFQLPLQLVGTILLVAIGIFYYLSEKNSLKRRMRVTLITFLSSIYVIMAYFFLNLILHLYTYLSISLLNSTLYSTLVLVAFFLLVEYALRSLKSTIISSEKNRSIGETFSKYFIGNAIISLLLILVFSDAVVIYSMFLEESILAMILWTGPFIFFIAGFYMNALRINLEFKTQIGLLERPKLEEELNRLTGTKTNDTTCVKPMS